MWRWTLPKSCRAASRGRPSPSVLPATTPVTAGRATRGTSGPAPRRPRRGPAGGWRSAIRRSGGPGATPWRLKTRPATASTTTATASPTTASRPRAPARPRTSTGAAKGRRSAWARPGGCAGPRSRPRRPATSWTRTVTARPTRTSAPELATTDTSTAGAAIRAVTPRSPTPRNSPATPRWRSRSARCRAVTPASIARTTSSACRPARPTAAPAPATSSAQEAVAWSWLAAVTARAPAQARTSVRRASPARPSRRMRLPVTRCGTALRRTAPATAP